MKVLFVNDTSAFHCGSWAACEVIKQALATRGHSIIPEADIRVVDATGLEACDAVLVNGEGTLHDNSQRSIRILQMLEQAQRMGKPTALCNASWFGMTDAYDHVLLKLDALSVRESLSLDILRRSGIHADIALDASYWHPARPAGAWPRARVRSTDLYWPAVRGFVLPTGGQLSKFEALHMDRLDWPGMLDAVAASETLLTGRHHGVYAACRTRTPFVALSGNTPKIEGLVAWSGLDLPVTDNPAELASLLARVGRYRGAFDRLFDWMDRQPPWKAPF